MVVANGSLSPLTFITLEGGAVQELCSMHNIFTATEDPNSSWNVLYVLDANEEARNHPSNDEDARGGASVGL